MARLRVERRIPLADYTPKPGDGRDTHAEIIITRDTDRKTITLTISTIGVRENATAFRLGAPYKKVKLADSPTHAPKAFASIAAPHLTSIDTRSGETWESVLATLATQDLKPAMTPRCPACAAIGWICEKCDEAQP